MIPGETTLKSWHRKALPLDAYELTDFQNNTLHYETVGSDSLPKQVIIPSKWIIHMGCKREKGTIMDPMQKFSGDIQK